MYVLAVYGAMNPNFVRSKASNSAAEGIDEGGMWVKANKTASRSSQSSILRWRHFAADSVATP